MTSSIQEDGNTLAGWDGHAEVHSIYEAMQQLTNPRQKQRKRYSIALILTYLLLGKAAGETTLQAITEWVRLRGTWLQQVLSQAGPQFPCAATYSNVLRAIDPAQLNEILMDLLTRARAEKREEGEQEHVALDGKTLRGTQGHLPEDQKKMHQVSLYETQTGIILAEQIVGDKENELSRINEFLKPQWIQGRIVSADAFHTQHAFCLGVTAAGGEYVLFAKGNQPTLHEDLQLFFREPPLDCRDWRTAQTCSSGHGRVEMRDLVASRELNDFLVRPWVGISQVFRLRRRVCKPLICTQEIVYGFTSLPSAKAGPQRLLELIRDHWAIENRLHRRRVGHYKRMHVRFVKGALLEHWPSSTASFSQYLTGLGSPTLPVPCGRLLPIPFGRFGSSSFRSRELNSPVFLLCLSRYSPHACIH